MHLPQPQNDKSGGVRLAKSLEINVQKIKKEFQGVDTLVDRGVENRFNPAVRCHIFFSDGMVNNQYVNDNIVAPVMGFQSEQTPASMLDFLLSTVLQVNEVKKSAELDEIAEAIVYGDTVLLTEGCDEALLLNTKGWSTRGIEEPDAERVLQGPREGFSEGLLHNLSLLRRRVKTRDLKMQYRTFGSETKTKACVCWIGRLAKPEILEELNRRLDRFGLDGALDTNYLAEYIRDPGLTPFQSYGVTERPDVVAAKLLEGRVAIFLDGTPVVLTVPYLFIENFQSSEDYYLNYLIANLYRALRVAAFLISVVLPALYLAVTSIQQELLPTPLILSISIARQGVPFPTILEILLMWFMFDILRQTGVRSGSNIGQAVSIVGALVIGQAAVEAKIASAPVIIVIAVMGITSLIVPRLYLGILSIRAMLLALSFVLGLFGILMGLMGLLVYLVSLRSFGVSSFYIHRLEFQAHKDTLIRAPWYRMKTRPQGLSEDPVRSGPEGKPEQ